MTVKWQSDFSSPLSLFEGVVISSRPWSLSCTDLMQIWCMPCPRFTTETRSLPRTRHPLDFMLTTASWSRTATSKVNVSLSMISLRFGNPCKIWFSPWNKWKAWFSVWKISNPNWAYKQHEVYISILECWSWHKCHQHLEFEHISGPTFASCPETQWEIGHHYHQWVCHYETIRLQRHQPQRQFQTRIGHFQRHFGLLIGS